MSFLPESLYVLRNRRFRMYWIGQGISLTGTWMQIMAQGWVVTRLSASAWVLGTLNVTTTFPILMLSMLAGSLADRFEKRRILIMTQVALMGFAFVLAALVISEQIALWHIFAIGLCSGVATAFDLPAAQALPPELVQRAEIPKAVALMQSIFHGSRLIGPAVAGVLMAKFGEGSAFLLNGFSFIAVIATLVAIGDGAATRGARPRKHGGIREGLRYVRHHDTLRPLMTLLALTTVFVFPFLVVLLLYFLRHVLAVDTRGMGLVLSASGLGSLIGAVMLLFGNSHTLKIWLYAGVLGIGGTFWGISISHSMMTAVPLVAVMSFCVASTMGRISQTVQEIVPNELRGRVMGIYGIAFSGLMPYAALFFSALTDGIGFAPTMRICAGFYVTLGLAILLRLPQPAPHADAESSATS